MNYRIKVKKLKLTLLVDELNFKIKLNSRITLNKSKKLNNRIN